ncbi:MAG: efflux RND transporter periplasmic adaptor subunit [Gemmataceae bacterium]
MSATSQAPSPTRGNAWIGKTLFIGATIVVLTLALMFLAGVFHRKIPSEPHGRAKVDPTSLNLAEIRSIRRPRYETAVGTIRAVHEAGVASRVLARVVEVNVKAGQPVQQGDVLFRLDDADLQARFKQAEAALTAAKANREQAASEMNRAQSLWLSKAIAASEYDRAGTTLRTADAELARATQGVQESQALLSYATIKSPMAGIIVDKKAEVGDTAVPGQVLATVYNPGKMQLVASVRESLALRLKVGQKVPGRLESLDQECEATISEIVPEAQSSSRSFIVKATGPCPSGVYSGMFGRLSIPLDEEEIIVVPAGAVQRVGQLEMIRVFQDGQVMRRSIRTGRLLGEQIEVLAGARPGEKLVVGSHEEGRP